MALIRDWSTLLDGRSAIVSGSGAGVGRAIAHQLAQAGASVWVNDLHLELAEAVVAEIEADGRLGAAGGRRRVRPRRRSRRARADRPPRHPRQQRGLGRARVHGRHRRDRAVRREQPRVVGAGDRGELLRRDAHDAHVPPGDARAALGSHRHDRLRRRPQGRTQPGRLRRGEGGRDGLHARASPRRSGAPGSLPTASLSAPSRTAVRTRAWIPTSTRRSCAPTRSVALGRPEDPAPLAVLLCSDAGEWITGQVYPVDGGYTSAL